MIKKIKTDQLRIGVFVHDFNCTNSQDRVFISKALIQTEKSIQIIRSWGIKEVYIDTEKGIDVESGKSAQEVRQKTDRCLHKIALQSKPIAPSIPLKEELKVVRNIKEEAVILMQRITDSMLDGKDVDVGSA